MAQRVDDARLLRGLADSVLGTQELQPPKQSVSLRVSCRASFRRSPFTTGSRIFRKKIRQFTAQMIDLHQEAFHWRVQTEMIQVILIDRSQMRLAASPRNIAHVEILV
jgi:DNA repair ATPase RecN